MKKRGQNHRPPAAKLVVRLEGDSAPDGQDDLDVIIQ